jgi:Ca-activated chloride channel family protein
MIYDPNDPRLTAYVLGELDPAERDVIETMLADCPECRQAIEEIRLTTGWLTQHLHDEQAAHTARAELNNQESVPAIAQSLVAARPWWRRKRRLLASAAAIWLIGAAGLSAIFLREVPQAHYAGMKSRRQIGNMSVALERKVDRNLMLRSRALGASDGTSATHFSELAVPALEPAAQPSAAAPAPAPAAPAGAATASPNRLADELQSRSQVALSRRAGRTPVSSQAGDVKLGRGMSEMMKLGDSGRKGKFGFGLTDSLAVAGNAPRAERAPRAVKDLSAAGGAQGRSVAGNESQLARRQLSFQARNGQNATQKASGPHVSQAPAQQAANQNQDLATRTAETKSQLALAQLKEGIPAQAGIDSQKEARQERLAEESKSAQAARPEQEAIRDKAAQLEVVAELAEEEYAARTDNRFQAVAEDALSTFSIDVDTASYSNVRRFLAQNMLPPPDAVRIEELLNYFPYHDQAPETAGPDPFAVHAEIAACPWNARNRLARIGIAARPVDQSRRPASNLVFLVDVSGSMDSPNKLPLVQWGLSRLVEQLSENDRVAIVVYAAASGLALPSTSCMHKAKILSSIESLRAEGGTNGAAGLQLAYDVAAQNFIKNGTNRVILATDGDFNIGPSDNNQLVRLITAKAKSKVFLSVLGFGMGNIKDAKLEMLADKGNGHYAYIDSPHEAYRVLIEQMGATLVTVAKDVKIQVAFNPSSVARFRLLGYENRIMPHQAFADDTKDAGEIGAGHHVTALYEFVPPATSTVTANFAAGREAILAAKKPGSDGAKQTESLTVKLRYKKPDEDQSREIVRTVSDGGLDFARASDDLKLASAVAGFGMLLRSSPYKGTLTYDGVLEIAQRALADDPSGYHREFVGLVAKAKTLAAAVSAPVAAPR